MSRRGATACPTCGSTSRITRTRARTATLRPSWSVTSARFRRCRISIHGCPCVDDRERRRHLFRARGIAPCRGAARPAGLVRGGIRQDGARTRRSGARRRTCRCSRSRRTRLRRSTARKCSGCGPRQSGMRSMRCRSASSMCSGHGSAATPLTPRASSGSSHNGAPGSRSQSFPTDSSGVTWSSSPTSFAPFVSRSRPRAPWGGEVFNIGTGRNYSILEIADLIGGPDIPAPLHRRRAPVRCVRRWPTSAAPDSGSGGRRWCTFEEGIERLKRRGLPVVRDASAVAGWGRGRIGPRSTGLRHLRGRRHQLRQP